MVLLQTPRDAPQTSNYDQLFASKLKSQLHIPKHGVAKRRQHTSNCSRLIAWQEQWDLNASRNPKYMPREANLLGSIWKYSGNKRDTIRDWKTKSRSKKTHASSWLLRALATKTTGNQMQWNFHRMLEKLSVPASSPPFAVKGVGERRMTRANRRERTLSSSSSSSSPPPSPVLSR